MRTADSFASTVNGIYKPYLDLLSAGRELALRYAETCADADVVLAIANGGVPAGFAMAKQLRMPLDVILIRRLIATENPLMPVCAVSIGGTLLFADTKLRNDHLPVSHLDHFVCDALDQLTQRAQICRASQKPITLTNKRVLLVDNGIHTGSTMLIVLRSLKKLRPAHISICVPVAAAASRSIVEPHADRLLCPYWSEKFGNVAVWYSRFDRPEDNDIQEFMRSCHESVE